MGKSNRMVAAESHIGIDWSNAPLARFALGYLAQALSPAEQPLRAMPPIETSAAPEVILIAISTDWNAIDLTKRLSHAGLRLVLDGANQWHLVAREGT
jgi:hypothetical protein